MSLPPMKLPNHPILQKAVKDIMNDPELMKQDGYEQQIIMRVMSARLLKDGNPDDYDIDLMTAILIHNFLIEDEIIGRYPNRVHELCLLMDQYQGCDVETLKLAPPEIKLFFAAITTTGLLMVLKDEEETVKNNVKPNFDLVEEASIYLNIVYSAVTPLGNKYLDRLIPQLLKEADSFLTKRAQLDSKLPTGPVNWDEWVKKNGRALF